LQRLRDIIWTPFFYDGELSVTQPNHIKAT